MDSKILKTLEKGAMKSGEIAEAVKADKKEVDKAIKKLVGEGKVYSPKRCHYELKK